ncbi:MAG TPA: hypothetical protein VMH78_04835 [Thermoplasmata archaeon]|nr:hypothetical protein [Thermoplasmata archaeon]
MNGVPDYSVDLSQVNPDVTTGWMQFSVFLPSGGECGFIVDLEATNGSIVAVFNSSLSTWDSGWGPNVQTAGGWTSGFNVSVPSMGVLTLKGPEALSGAVWVVGVGFSPTDGEVVPLDL